MFDEERTFDLLQRGVSLALKHPNETVTVYFDSVRLYVEIVLDEEDRDNPVFIETIANLALDDVKRVRSGRKPRFVPVYKYGGLVLRG